MSCSIALAAPRARSTGTRAAIVVVVALAARGAAAEPSGSADDRARAAALLATGNAAMARDDAATAAAHYRAAWRLVPEARFALNLGIALAVMGRTAAAAEAFAIYIADPAADRDKRAVLEARLRAWRGALGELVLDVSPAAAAVEIDGEAPLRSAPGTSVPVAPGSHLVTARAPGHRTAALRVEVGRQRPAIAHLALVPDPPESGIEPRPAAPAGRDLAEQPREGERDTRPRWIALGVAVAAVAAGGYFGATAIERWHTVDAHCPAGACTSPADLALAADARSAGTRADIAFAAGGAALLAAVVLWRLEPRAHPGVALVPRASGGVVLCIAGAL